MCIDSQNTNYETIWMNAGKKVSCISYLYVLSQNETNTKNLVLFAPE